MILNPSEKNMQLLSYILERRPNSGVTELMKLCYLIDLTSLEKGLPKISDFKYIRYTYGPFDEVIYPCLKILVSKKRLSEHSSYTTTNNEYITYSLNEDITDTKYDLLNEESKNVINEVLDVMRGHGAKALTDLAYKTRPMKKIGATLGGNEKLNCELELNA